MREGVEEIRGGEGCGGLEFEKVVRREGGGGGKRRISKAGSEE